jgi:hypothetical protein
MHALAERSAFEGFRVQAPGLRRQGNGSAGERPKSADVAVQDKGDRRVRRSP